MLTYVELEKYICNMIKALIGSNYASFNFSADPTHRVLAERQKISVMPDAKTIVTIRIDNYNNWRAQRYGRGTVYYGADGSEHIYELRTFDVYVNVMSKGLGDAFDAARFIIANLQNNRYNEFVRQSGRLLGLERVSTLKNLSDLENGVWTERAHFEMRMNFKEEVVVSDPVEFVNRPDTLDDLPDSVELTTELKK